MLSPRTLRLLLILSVTLNLAIAGIVAGAALRHPPPPDPGRGPAFGAYDRAFSEEDRKAMRDAFHREAPDFGKGWQAMKDDTADLLTTLRTEPYDPARTEAIFARQRERGGQMMALGQRLMAQRLAEMTPEERLAFANRLAERMERDRPHPKDH
ncbi:periplasmic heavy metal sensor [Falsirhodobacter sp. 20TX0035]|uniref:periplasmic heavy metal sensor n=1 Tax=Falsirhodobacter sp. 20TX0035 TaxID=3022019 RepID=UPI00232BBA29|nr:periplasmic heavy metal sensor [Falsirhodobacter sp. 20TX0035]MDB6452390.1 periplasmic heavy metal sensor [Falsirhodobacter sp. 20TX0035]